MIRRTQAQVQQGGTASQEYTITRLAECLDKLNEALVGKEGEE